MDLHHKKTRIRLLNVSAIEEMGKGEKDASASLFCVVILTALVTDNQPK